MAAAGGDQPRGAGGAGLPYAATVVQRVAGRAGDFGALVVHFLLTVLITAILYTTGETAAAGVRRFAHRLAGDRGMTPSCSRGRPSAPWRSGWSSRRSCSLSPPASASPLSGSPTAAVLTAIVLILCIAQLGPFLVLAPAVAWLYWSGDAVWGTALLVWTVLVGVLDNVLRPMLIRRGADLPMLLIFAGVIGGLISFGIIGLFVGPVILAVTYRLLEAWIMDVDRQPGRGVGPTPAVSE